jgi:hypothetical protein
MDCKKILVGVFVFAVICAIAFAVTKIRKGKENFLNYPLTQVVQHQVARNTNDAVNGKFFAVPGTWQNRLSPRMGPGEGLRSAIKYDLPSRGHMAVPENPLSRSSDVREGFKDSNSCGSYTATPVGIAPMKPDFAAGNYDQVAGRSGAPLSPPLRGGELLTQSSKVDGIYNKQGDYIPLVEGEIAPLDAPVVLQNLMYSSQKSRVYGQQDPIRGSLPIAPHKPTQDCMWFTVSAQPERDLNAGALAVMGGISEQSAKLAALKTQNSGNSVTTYSGINWLNSHPSTTSIDTALSQFTGTVESTSFA